MADTTSVDTDRLRELVRVLTSEGRTVGGRTPAGALTTAAEAVPGSLVAAAHGSVSPDLLALQESVAGRIADEVLNLGSAADRIDEQERANADAIRSAGGPR